MTETSPPPAGFDSDKRGPSQAELELRVEMAELTVALVKGILQSSYYSPDHPSSKGLAMAAFNRIKRLEGRFSEITYLMQLGADQEDMFLDGAFTESVALSSLIRTTMGEHFAQKMLSYFKRNSLVSLSLRSSIAEDEFDRFLTIFVERHLEGGGDNATDTESRFTEKLIDSNVVSVSVILEDDLVQGRRQLPWRVRMAISRLRKDLRVVPMYARATRKELQSVKNELLQDITRPLRRPEFLRELLVNSDLVTRDVEELRGVDVEQDIIGAFSKRMLNAVAWSLISELERFDLDKLKAEGDAEKALVVQAVKRNLRKIALRLIREEADQALDMVRHLFDFKLLNFEELPPRLQQQLQVESWTEEFVKNPEESLQRFERPSSEEEYLNELSRLTAIFSSILEAKRFAEAARILRSIMEQVRVPVAEMPRRQEYASQAINRLRTPDVYRLMSHAMDTEDRELREGLRTTIVMLGVGCAPDILEVLRESASSAVRKDCAEAIVAIGPLASKAVIRDLRQHHRRWQYARSLLMLLGELGGDEGPAELLRFMANPNPKLREEALVGLHKARGKRAEPQLLTALSDDNSAVRRRAIVLLNSVGSRSRDLIDFVSDVLRPYEAKEQEPPTSLQEIAIHTAIRLGNVALEDGTTLEDVLCDVVQAGRGGALRRMLRRTTHAKPGSLRMSALDALGRIGTARCIPVLEAAMKERNDDIYDHAVTAHDLIIGKG